MPFTSQRSALAGVRRRRAKGKRQNLRRESRRGCLPGSLVPWLLETSREKATGGNPFSTAHVISKTIRHLPFPHRLYNRPIGRKVKSQLTIPADAMSGIGRSGMVAQYGNLATISRRKR